MARHLNLMIKESGRCFWECSRYFRFSTWYKIREFFHK